MKCNQVRFQYSGHGKKRESEREISPVEVLECIARGDAIHWEAGFDPHAKSPDMRMRFQLAMKTRAIAVVVAVSDFEPDVVVVTLIVNPKR